jgi:phospholipid transport system substrate-binding protein
MSLLKSLLIVGAGLVLLSPPALAATSPRAQVQETVDQVLAVLRDQALDGQPRREALSRLIRARFDFTIMSQRTLGKYWKDASVQERTRFIALYADLLEASYIGRIEAYVDETVSYLGERVDGDLAEVDTKIHSGNIDIPISYRMTLENGQWYVYDVIIEEVSLIKNYRSSYGEIVRKEGYAGLLTRMEEKINSLRSSPGGKKKG